MKFPALKGKKTVRFTVDTLYSGCNLRDGYRRTPDTQLCEAENVWWYKGALRTRPAFAVREELQQNITQSEITWKFCGDDTVKGEYTGRRFLRREQKLTDNTVSFQSGILTADGNIVYEGSIDGLDSTIQGMLIEYPYTDTENVLVFLSDGNIYAQHNDTGAWRLVTDNVYVPCVLKGAYGAAAFGQKPYSEGEPYEELNMLSGRFTVQYTTGIGGKIFYLPYTDFDTEWPITITVKGGNDTVTEYVMPPKTAYSDYAANGLRAVLDRQNGFFCFVNQQGERVALEDGPMNNMSFCATVKRSEKDKTMVASMQFSTWFGGLRSGKESRLFIGGSAEYKNRIYWCDEQRPLYFPASKYITVGDANWSVTAFGKQDGVLVIFKDREMYGLRSVQELVPVEEMDGQLQQIHGQIGCVAPQTVTLCGDRLCWADGNGKVYTLIDGTSGYSVRELSALIAPALKEHTAQEWREANGALYEGHYLLRVGHKIYVLRVDEKAFSRYANVYSDSKAQQGLAWYVWTLPDTCQITYFYGNGSSVAGMVKYTTPLDSQMCAMPLYLRTVEEDITENLFENPRAISARLRTKEYDFGNPITQKRVLRVYLGIETDANTEMAFVYFKNGVACREIQTVMGETATGLVLTPNLARVQRFGFELTSLGDVAIDSVTFTYR